MSDLLKLGILGCARIVRRGMAEGLRQSGVAQWWAVASRDHQKASAWAREFHVPRHYGSYQALLDDPEIDAVYLPLPNEEHRVWALAAAAAGKHVLCEKPLGLDLDDAEAMVQGCAQQGVVLMEAFMWRHHPRTAHLVSLLAGSQLGTLRQIKMDFSFRIDPGDWRLDAARGGGALYDLGCYAINAARLLAGSEPLEVLARARRHASGVDLTTGLIARFPNDVLLVADCSFECAYRNRLEVVCTHGTAELPDGVLPATAAELLLRDAEGHSQVVRFPAAQQYAEQVRAFCAGVRAGVLPAPAENGLANMRALDQARRSYQAP